MKTAIITDSAANLSKSFIDKNDNLFVVPLLITIDGKSYRDQIEITADEVYDLIDEKQMKTSLPMMEDLDKIIEEIKNKGYENVIVITVSSGLSGTYNAFRLHLDEVKDLDITVYNSKTIGGGQGYLVKEALELTRKDATTNEIISALDVQRYDDSLAIYTINTLKYLKAGGRIGRVEGTIGDLLNIKPVISVDDDDGKYITLSKSFGLKRALISMKKLIIERFKNYKIDLTVHYASNLEKAKSLGKSITKVIDVRHLTYAKLTPVLGIHTGPDMYAYVARIIR